MDKQRVKGSAQQAKGKIKELAGKAVGNRKLQAKGEAEKASGKIRNAVGGKGRHAREVAADDTVLLQCIRSLMAQSGPTRTVCYFCASRGKADISIGR